MSPPETTWPPPEAVLIRRAREARGLSPAEAAARLSIRLGPRRWRQLEDGYESRGGRKVAAGDKQLAHMAHAVGLTPERLEEAGRPDAAAILREIAVMAVSDDGRRIDEQLDQNAAVLAEIDELLRQARPSQRRAVLELLKALTGEDGRASAG